jgi:hypothetical protein
MTYTNYVFTKIVYCNKINILWWYNPKVQHYSYESPQLDTSLSQSCPPPNVQCVSLAGSPGKCWFTKGTKVQYTCMSYLYEMRLSQEVLEMSSLSVNTQLNMTLRVSEDGCQNLWCHHLDFAPDVLP